MKSLAQRIAALALDDRSIGGVTRYESSEKPQKPFTSAYGPEPPVRLASGSGQDGSAPATTFQSSPAFVSTVQPGGIAPPSKLSEKTAGPNVPGA